MDGPLDDLAGRWQREGWVLVPGLVPPEEIDEALEDLWRLHPRPEEFHRGVQDSTRANFFAGADDRNLFASNIAAQGPAFRPEQFLGRALFPFPGSGALNRLVVHDRVVGFAEAALESTDLRLYQLATWAKYTGVANYEQPLHQDHNHSVVPPRCEPGWWHLEGFLYLSDVDDDVAPTRLVDTTVSGGRLTIPPQSPEAAPDLYAAEQSAAGIRGSFLAYRPDVFHRGVDLTRPGGSRFLLGLGFKLAGQDWIGYDQVQPRSTAERFARFVSGCTPRQLALFGVPLPGHAYWTEATLAAMAQRYHDLDLAPWRAGLVPAENQR